MSKHYVDRFLICIWEGTHSEMYISALDAFIMWLQVPPLKRVSELRYHLMAKLREDWWK